MNFKQIGLIMRLTTVLLIASLMQVSAAGLAQRISLSKANVPLKEVLNELSRQSGYDFVYTDVLLKKSAPVKLNVKNATLDEVLKLVFDNQPLSYSIEDKTVVIKENEPSFLDKTSLVILNAVKNLYQDPVRGKVVDEQGNPMPNATIVLKGKSQVYRSNNKGEFNISNVPDDAVLVISYVGYKTLEVNIKDAVLPLEIKLNQTAGELEEVKIEYSTGYQTLNKERATGSFVYVDNELFNRTVSTNTLDRLLNVTSGLTKTVGGAATSTDVSIRGLSTINANTQPLIVIDGFPYEEKLGSAGLGVIQLNNLNPNDVESVTILRDAAAASIWGARSANGVIVITTKQGRYNQKNVIQINSSFNLIERPNIFTLNILSATDAIKLEKALFESGIYNSYNGPFTSTYSYPIVSPGVEILLAEKRGELSKLDAETKLDQLANHDVRNDIKKYLLRVGANQQYNLSIAGGSDKMNYYGSLGYDRNQASDIGNHSERLTLRIDNNYRPVKRLEVSTYVSLTQSENQNNALNYLEYIADGTKRMSPYMMLADNSGNPAHVPIQGTLRAAYIDTLQLNGLLDWHYKPLDDRNNIDILSKLFSFRVGSRATYSIFPGISININSQYERHINIGKNHYSIDSYLARDLINRYMSVSASGQSQYPIPLGGIVDFNNQNMSAYSLRGQLDITKEWQKHSIVGIIGAEARQGNSDSHSHRKYGYDPFTLTFSNDLDFKSLYSTRPNGNRTIFPNNQIAGTLNRFLSYYSNIAYSFSRKYMLSMSGRIDASNFFGIRSNLKSVPLWSIGGSWLLSKEDFFSSKTISSLKIKATYGFNGNLDNTATSFATIRYNSSTANPYNNSQPFATRATPPNPGLSWEKVGISNVGIEFELFDNRLVGSFDYYVKKANNLIGLTQADPTVGVSQYSGNVAGIKVKGFDLALNSLILNRRLKLNSSLSLSYNNDKVVDFYLSPNILSNGNNYVSSIFPIVGRSRYGLFSYKWAGLDSSTGAPMGIVNGEIVPYTTVLGYNSTFTEPNTKPEDVIYHGQTSPQFFGNFLNAISYKNFSASFNILYKFNYYFRRQSVNYNTFQDSWSMHGDYALRWQKSGDELKTHIPSMPIVPDERYSFYSLSEVLVDRADHIKLQDVRLSYTLGTKSKTTIFKKSSIFLYANNLGIIFWRANENSIDPDFVNAIPIPRSLSFGLTIKL